MVVVIPPKQIKNLRGRYGSAGNKDDRFDAYVLADTLRTDRARLRPLVPDSEATVALRAAVRARKDLVEHRVALCNQLRAHLQAFYPAPVGLFHELDGDTSLKFLARFDCQDRADWLSPKRLAGFLKGIRYSGSTTPEAMHARITAAPHGATGDLGAATVHVTRALWPPSRAACATRGWPAGLAGRRDAFLIVLAESLGYPHRTARGLRPADITEPPAGPPGGAVPCLQGRAVPGGGDPRTCPACAVARWLDILGVADGVGRGSARMALTAADARTPTSPHQHTPSEPARWRAAAVLLPAIDRHGWLDDYRPVSTRAIRTRLALAAGRADTEGLLTEPPDTPPEATDPAATTAPTGPARPAPELHEVLTLLDDLAEDADALNTHIQALLDDHRPSRR